MTNLIIFKDLLKMDKLHLWELTLTVVTTHRAVLKHKAAGLVQKMITETHKQPDPTVLNSELGRLKMPHRC